MTMRAVTVTVGLCKQTSRPPPPCTRHSNSTAAWDGATCTSDLHFCGPAPSSFKVALYEALVKHSSEPHFPQMSQGHWSASPASSAPRLSFSQVPFCDLSPAPPTLLGAFQGLSKRLLKNKALSSLKGRYHHYHFHAQHLLGSASRKLP